MSEVNNCCGTTCDKAKAVAEYDALRADNVKLNRRCYALMSMIDRYAVGIARCERKEAWSDNHPLVEINTLTPTQCLVDVQSAAVDNFTTALGAAWRSDWDMLEISEFADEYARGIK